jgi:hypothetical protein
MKNQNQSDIIPVIKEGQPTSAFTDSSGEPLVHLSRRFSFPYVDKAMHEGRPAYLVPIRGTDWDMSLDGDVGIADRIWLAHPTMRASSRDYSVSCSVDIYVQAASLRRAIAKGRAFAHSQAIRRDKGLTTWAELKEFDDSPIRILIAVDRDSEEIVFYVQGLEILRQPIEVESDDEGDE